MLSHKHLRSPKALFTQVVLLVAALLVLPASGQNTINTIAGGGPINSNPLQLALPGPTGITEDASGNLYIVTPTAQQVLKLSGGTSSLLAGAGYYSYHPSGGSWNGPATQEPMADPFGLAVDAQGNVYVADTNNFVIRVVNTQSHPINIAGVQDIPPGDIWTIAGDHNECGGGPCGDKGPATEAKLNGAQGVALDINGNIYLADTNGNRVRCVINAKYGCGDKKGKYAIGTILDYAGEASGASCQSSTALCGDDGPATEAQLNSPMGISLDANGDLYIADTFDNRIRCVIGAPNGCGGSTYSVGDIVTVAGSGNLCNGSGSCGDNGPATGANANMSRPRGVSVDGSGNFYIADTRDNRVRCVLAVAGGCGGSGQSIGNIITFAGTVGSGGYGFSGDGGSPTNAQLAGPNGVLVDKSGNVFIADTLNVRVREVTGGLTGVINTIMGGGTGGDNGPPTSATLGDPYAVVVDSSNNYYIADTADNRIRVVNTQNSVITVAGVQIQPGQIATVAGNGNVNYLGDTGPATQASLDSPEGEAVDSMGNIYIADTGNAVVRCVLNVSGGCGGSSYPIGTIITFAGTGRSCPGPSQCGDGGPATDAQLTPDTLAVDSSGNVYISDAYDNRIRCVIGASGACEGLTGSAGTIVTVAGTGTACTDYPNCGDGGPATDADLSRPFGIALDTSDDMYIADAGDNVVRCVLGVSGACGGSPDQYYIFTYVYQGGEEFCCKGNQFELLRTDVDRWAANTVAVDVRGNLFIGGGQNNIVQRVDLNANTIYTVAGNQNRLAWGLYGDGGPATLAELDNIGQAITNGVPETLLIADASNNRIRAVTMVPVVSFTPGSLNFGYEPVGQTSNPMSVTLQNTGDDDLNIASIAVSGDFALYPGNTTCSTNSAVAPTWTCTISVTFTPTKKGNQTGHIIVTDNGYNSPQRVKLTGFGD